MRDPDSGREESTAYIVQFAIHDVCRYQGGLRLSARDKAMLTLAEVDFPMNRFKLLLHCSSRREGNNHRRHTGQSPAFHEENWLDLEARPKPKE